MSADFLKLVENHELLKKKCERVEEKCKMVEEKCKMAEEKRENAEAACLTHKKRILAVVAASAGTVRCSQALNPEAQLERCGYDVIKVIVATKQGGDSEGF